FLPHLGIGDLLMLSPIITHIAKHFESAAIHLLTHHPNFIQFPENVHLIPPNKAASRYDLLLSISPHTKHVQYIRRSEMWYGYFFSTQIISNISGTQSKKCDVHQNHHIHKGSLILAEKQLFGKLFKPFPAQLTYPDLHRKELSADFKDTQYLAIGIFPQFPQSEWSLSKFAYIINRLFEESIFERLVILGGKSAREQVLNHAFQILLKVAPDKRVDLVGKTTLAKATTIIATSTAFLGIDSGLAHIAYLVAPMSFVVFTIAHPVYRLPLHQDLRDKITTFHPYEDDGVPIFDGQHPLSEQQVKAIGERLDEREITSKIIEKMSAS
ncbi:MAG: glycosyltransferase family 9 protein, partial [Bacteroidota bacterium]